ncbi:hypothetical protein ACETKC_16170 [Brevundimonas intermedia]|nr:hypothetical protein [Brevundimonas intermedia]
MSRLTGPDSGRSQRTDIHSAATSPFDRPSDTEPGAPDPLDIALAEIEAGALEVYARAGLPTDPGHYRKPPDTDAWTFIAATLPPEARFALTLEHPAEMGWRFARLQDLGARSDRPDLQAASRLLNDIADLRAARRGRLTEDHLIVAMELGGAWRALRDSKAVKASRLTLTPPSSPKKPRAKRDKGVKPR